MSMMMPGQPRSPYGPRKAVSSTKAHESADELGNESEPIPEEVLNNMGAGSGLRVWADVFRRADKNDDGAIDFEEFRAFFRYMKHNRL
tara:strand:- start:328 stop:591 length:264 start_codon:yes stop_codon:yes gene_type:complete